MSCMPQGRQSLRPGGVVECATFGYSWWWSGCLPPRSVKLYTMYRMTERTRERDGRLPLRANSFATNAALALASCAACALLMIAGEALARLGAPDYLIRTRGVHVFSGSYGWRGRPGAVAPMGDGRVSLNRHGFRGRELGQLKSVEKTRVIVLGDSIAFGFGVSDEQTFPHLLDARDNGIEVASLAVQGHGPSQELLMLRSDGLAADPDIVVLALCLRNDFADAVLPVALYNGVTPRPRFHLVGDRLVLDSTGMRRSTAERAVQWLSDYSHLFNRVWSLVGTRSAPTEEIWRDRKREALRDEEAALRLTLALVLEMDRVARERGIAFVVASFPNGLSYTEEPKLHRRLHDELRRAQVRLVDFRARFQELGRLPGEIALDSTGHLGPLGHALVAETLESEIAALRTELVAGKP